MTSSPARRNGRKRRPATPRCHRLRHRGCSTRTRTRRRPLPVSATGSRPHPTRRSNSPRLDWQPQNANSSRSSPNGEGRCRHRLSPFAALSERRRRRPPGRTWSRAYRPAEPRHATPTVAAESTRTPCRTGTAGGVRSAANRCPGRTQIGVPIPAQNSASLVPNSNRPRLFRYSRRVTGAPWDIASSNTPSRVNARAALPGRFSPIPRAPVDVRLSTTVQSIPRNASARPSERPATPAPTTSTDAPTPTPSTTFFRSWPPGTPTGR